MGERTNKLAIAGCLCQRELPLATKDAQIEEIGELVDDGVGGTLPADVGGIMREDRSE